jgi:hypothetical protein
MPSPRILPLPAAARELGRPAHTLRSWVRAGAPVVRPGRNGPGGAALVDVDALRSWRARGTDDAPLVRVDESVVARGLLAAFREGTHGDLDVTQRQLASVLCMAFAAIVRAVTSHPPAEPWPPEIVMLMTIAVPSQKR